MVEIQNRDLVQLLKEKGSHIDAGVLDRIKITYRPLVAPFQEMLGLVDDGAKVFDIGCGNGQFLLLVAAFTKAAAVYGVEINDRLVANATALLRDYRDRISVGFETFDGEHLPAKLREYDHVFFNDALCYVDAPKQFAFLQRIYDSLEKGTKFVLKDMDASNALVYIDKIHNRILGGKVPDQLPYDEAARMLRDIGFKIESESRRRMYVYCHYTIVARK